jgi:hypothetical protein
VTFFQQGTVPCVSPDGRFIMETPYKVPLSAIIFVKNIIIYSDRLRHQSIATELVGLASLKCKYFEFMKEKWWVHENFPGCGSSCSNYIFLF